MYVLIFDIPTDPFKLIFWSWNTSLAFEIHVLQLYFSESHHGSVASSSNISQQIFLRIMSGGSAYASEPFDHAKADIILRSSDNIDFHVFKLFLSLASPFFEDMFNIP